MTEQEEIIQNLTATTNIFAKTLFLSMEEGEGVLVNATNDSTDYKKDDLLVIAKLNGIVSIVQADNVVNPDMDLVEGTWVKVGTEQTPQSETPEA